ncbi:MAG: DUF262 domain-containing protein [Hyphomicrobiales bacterium]|nr:DUF262 domain-containing protein [Hyphomicrobiales bacterium]
MKAKNDKAIGNWLSDIEDGVLCLPRFQRFEVWKKEMICRFLKTLISDSGTPVGIFLVLSTDSSKQAFSIRTIGGAPSRSKSCSILLLDGQQRLSALWRALHDTDEGFRYFAEFNDQFKIEEIRAVKKDSKTDRRLYQNPTEQYKKRYFPIELLNPLSEEGVVDAWLQSLDLQKLQLTSYGSIKRLIANTRKIFAKQQRRGKVIPYFQLGRNVDRNTAISVYSTINSNSVKLSDYYHAVAKMDKEVKKSPYDMAKRLIKRVNDIEVLESDEIAELILKVSCVLQDKSPSGGNCKSLNFNQVVKDESKIFDGVEWAVGKLKELQIWHGNQLPSLVPLRVLPAIHHLMPKSGAKFALANEIIGKYLWHAFLTDRYSKQANTRLKEDYDHLKEFLDETLEWAREQRKTEIFNKDETPHPSLNDIKKAGWPQSVGILSRGILLVCCQEGAKTLTGNESLTPVNYRNREKHHIFPKSKLKKEVGHFGNYALNCLLVPEKDNKKYSNELPGDYIKKLFEDLGTSLPQVDVVNRLETHLIYEKVARHLVGVTQEAIDNDKLTLKDAYDDFINDRAYDVETKIKELLG